jgi:predicted nucleic acid-binding protein
MIAAGTGMRIAFLRGDGGEDVELAGTALHDRKEVSPGCRQRAGALRAKVLAGRRKARLGDALIAQSCVDHAIPLLTRDRDFRTFAGAAGLNLILGPALD